MKYATAHAKAVGDSLRASGFDPRVIHEPMGVHEVPLETGHFVRVLPPVGDDKRIIFGLAQQPHYEGGVHDLGTTPHQQVQFTRSYASSDGTDAGEHLRTFMRDPAVVHAIRNDLNDRRLKRGRNG